MANERVHIFNHPLIHTKISYLRDKTTSSPTFRARVKELALLMAYEVTNDLEAKPLVVETPLAMAKCHRVDEHNIIIIPILRRCKLRDRVTHQKSP